MLYCVLATLVASIALVSVVLRPWSGSIELFKLSDRFVCELRLDGPARLFLLLIAFLWPLATLYATEYMKHETREGFFFAFYLLAYSEAILLAASANLFSLYVFYELLTLVTVPLVLHEKDTPSIRATRIYLCYLFGGAALGFVAMVVISGFAYGSFRLGGILPDVVENPTLLLWMAIIAFWGFGVKAAVFPLCRWLPKASVAPTPVTALLHAVAVVNAGVFAVMRVLYYVFGTAFLRGTFVQSAMLAASAFTVVYGAVKAVRENHFKRRLAWSTVSNLSYMLFGLSLLTPEGMAAALLHMVNHGLIKIVLFFCAGAVMIQTGRTQIRQLHGMARPMPYTFAAFTFAGLALMGLPPLPGFFSKYCLITAALKTAGPWQIAGCVALLISAVLTVLYIFSVVIPAYFMKLNAAAMPLPRETCDPGIPIRIALGVICAAILALSLFSGKLIEVLTAMAGA